MADRENWRKDAACRPGTGVDPRIFFPGPSDFADRAAARALCAGCPVREPCLEANLAEQDGIWGGTTERERRALRARRTDGRAVRRRCSWCLAMFDVDRYPAPATCGESCANAWRASQLAAARQRARERAS